MREKIVRKNNRTRRGRGEGSIFQREDGWWVGSISAGYTATGKRRRKTVYGRTKGELQAKIDRLRGDLAAGPPPDVGTMTVANLLDRWAAVVKDKTSTRTQEERDRLITNHIRPRLGTVKLAGLTDLHVEHLIFGMREAKVGLWTARHAVDVLSMACKYGVKKRLLKANPCDVIEKPKPERREMVSMTAPQVQAVLAAASGKPLYPLLAVALGTGCRMGELLGLGWKDVDLRHGRLTIRRALSQTAGGFVLKAPKTKAGRRTITLPTFARDALTALRAARTESLPADAPVFCTRTGGYLDKKNVLRAFKAIVKRTNATITEANEEHRKPIPDGMRFHDLRHTHASLLLSAGHSLRAVAQRLGHSDPAMTLRVYAHVLPTDDAQLASGLDSIIN